MTLVEVVLLIVGVAIAGLAGYMVGRAWAGESMFAGTQTRINEWAFDDDQQPRSTVKGKVGDLLSCAGCFGSWAAIVGFIVWGLLTGLDAPLGVWALACLAAAGLQLRWQHEAALRIEQLLLAQAQRERIEDRAGW